QSNDSSQHTRSNGSTHLQPEEIRAFCDEKTKYFSPSCFPPTRENAHFSKNTFLRPQKLVFKPTKFQGFIPEPKNKPRLKVLKRGLIFKTIFQKRGLCNGYPC